VHADNHCGRAAVPRETPDDGGTAAETEAKAADVRGADRAQKARLGQRFERSFWKGAVLIEVGRVGGHRLGTNLFQRCGVLCRIRAHAHLM
jgi:hypothetical protein